MELIDAAVPDRERAACGARPGSGRAGSTSAWSARAAGCTRVTSRSSDARPRRTTSPLCTGAARPLTCRGGRVRRSRTSATPGHDFPLAEEAGCDILFAPAGDVMFPRRADDHRHAPGDVERLPAAGGPCAPRPDRAGDVQALEHVRAVPQLLRREGLAAAGDVPVRLADDLEFPVEVLGCPTVREDDGLAVSSRNAQLTAEQRRGRPGALPRAVREP